MSDLIKINEAVFVNVNSSLISRIIDSNLACEVYYTDAGLGLPKTKENRVWMPVHPANVNKGYTPEVINL